MRIAAAAALFGVLCGSTVQASSILTLEASKTAPSLVAIGASPSTPSILGRGAAAAGTDPETVAAVDQSGSRPHIALPLPMVIRGGLVGDAFSHSSAPTAPRTTSRTAAPATAMSKQVPAAGAKAARAGAAAQAFD